MKKFNNIKVGDEVYFTEIVKYGVFSKKVFFIKKKVIDVKNVRFTIEGDQQFRISTGEHVRLPDVRVHEIGDRIPPNTIVEGDQSDLLEEFKSRQNICYKINSANINVNADMPTETLEEIFRLQGEIKLLISNSRK